jgi:hypothetical protein
LFGEASVKMLFYKIDVDDWNVLATFLTYIGRMPDKVPGTSHLATDIGLDEKVITELRKI